MPIAYATVYNRTQGKGTITDLDGYFRLNHVQGWDTLVISFIGFHQMEFKDPLDANGKTLYMDPRTEQLREVVVTANNDYLYKFLADAKKTQSNSIRTAKTYFSLATHTDEKQIEVVEGYYNGSYRGYDLQKLDMKNGRIALAEFNNRFFVSTGSSRVLQLHELFGTNEHFPFSPLEFSKGKMKKRFDLALVSEYVDESDRKIMVIDYEPYEENKALFKGRMWIDANTKQIQKVTLRVEDAKVYPFAPIWSNDALQRVDMNITKDFTELDGAMFMNSVTLNYTMQYKMRGGPVQNITSDAVLFAYDHQEAFELPFFEFTNDIHADLRNINAAPYNAFFWENIDEFTSSDRVEKNAYFIGQESTIDDRTLFSNNKYFEKGEFERPYVRWSEKRIRLREDIPDSVDYKEVAGALPSERYNLNVKIYLDVNTYNDSTDVLTSTIFDPYNTFFHYPSNKAGMAFINMYFDLMEIKRRELVDDIDASSRSLKEVRRLYDAKMEEAEETGRAFFKDVQHGTDPEGMMRWNKLIEKELQVNNVELFRLYSD